LLARPAWAETVLTGLAEPADKLGFNLALSCAAQLGIPVLEHALRHLNDNPDNAYVWQVAVKRADAGTIGRVAELARTVLPIADIASGPALSLGLGRGYQYDHALEIVVCGLAPYPSTAPDLVRAALASRVIRVRRAALGVLGRWPGDYRDWVADAAAAEPDAKLRAEMEKYLGGADQA
ncbi:MAG TPA: hypothetical protein VF482_08130, partial [Trebonia sp.]